MLFSIPVGDIVDGDKDPLAVTKAAEIAELNNRILERDDEIIQLQAKLIKVYDEMWSRKD